MPDLPGRLRQAVPRLLRNRLRRRRRPCHLPGHTLSHAGAGASSGAARVMQRLRLALRLDVRRLRSPEMQTVLRQYALRRVQVRLHPRALRGGVLQQRRRHVQQLRLRPHR
jgi:hypothetical protein